MKRQVAPTPASSQRQRGSATRRYRLRFSIRHLDFVGRVWKPFARRGADAAPSRDKFQVNCTDIWLETVGSVTRSAKEARITITWTASAIRHRVVTTREQQHQREQPANDDVDERHEHRPPPKTGPPTLPRSHRSTSSTAARLTIEFVHPTGCDESPESVAHRRACGRRPRGEPTRTPPQAESHARSSRRSPRQNARVDPLRVGRKLFAAADDDRRHRRPVPPGSGVHDRGHECGVAA